MIPPVIRPSSLPALAKCPCFYPDQKSGEDQKSDGTKRHTALGKYLADDPGWSSELGAWDKDGVEWAGEYVRTHAPMSDHPLRIEEPGKFTVLTDSLEFVEIPGTPDIFCGPVLFDLKGRDIDSYREQMDAYVLMGKHESVEAHVLYATEKRAETFSVCRTEAMARVAAIVEAVIQPARVAKVCDFCGWCANQKACPAFNSTGTTAAAQLGIRVPAGVIEDIRDADGLGDLKRAADAVGEWAKQASSHCREMAIKHGVVATGYQLRQRKGSPSITDAWAAIQASGLPMEAVATSLSITLADLSEAYALHHGLKESVAKKDVESRLGELVTRGSTVHYLQSL